MRTLNEYIWMAYATKEQLKTELGITGGEQDAYLDAVLERVSAWIDTQTNRTFKSQATTVTDELYERQGRTLWLSQLGITGVTSVKVRQLRTEDWRTLEPGTYEWTSNGRLYLPLDFRFVQVTYEYGTDATVPKDIELAALQLAADVYRGSRQGEQADVASERVGDYQVTYRNVDDVVKANDSNVQATLAAYRVRPI